MKAVMVVAGSDVLRSSVRNVSISPSRVSLGGGMLCLCLRRRWDDGAMG